MSEQNVIIPSAPPQQIYPQLPADSQGDTHNDSQGDLRLKKISDCQTEIQNEISHYKKHLKKYKRARYIVHNSSTFASVTSSTMTAGGLAISLSGVGVIVGAPITGVAALFGFVTAAFGIVERKLSKKISKHEKTIYFAEAKHRTISRLISKAMNGDTSISDVESNLILNEIEQYHEMKTSERIKLLSGKANTQTQDRLGEHLGENQHVDVKTFKEQIAEEIKREYQKKLGSLVNLATPKSEK